MYAKTYYPASPKLIRNASSEDLRDEFLITGLFVTGDIVLNYVHQERMVIGGAAPTDTPLRLPDTVTSSSDAPIAFMDRRELGVMNIASGKGRVTVDGQAFELSQFDALYIGMGARDVRFESLEADAPARFYLASTPAHKAYPTQIIQLNGALKLDLGTQATTNVRSIYQMIDPRVCPSAQLLMGITILNSGSVWNTNPPHLHDLRSEVYFYLNLGENDRVFHFMGEPDQTRHLVVKNEDAVICPSWSIHMGAGTSSYAFIWAMGGENQDYRDMNHIGLAPLK